MTPKSEDILKVINNFKRVLPMAKRDYQLCMSVAGVNINHQCGSIHCHGGWYAIATCDLSKQINYVDGAFRMSEDLGFNGPENLVIWAAQNLSLWGNNYGGSMFYCKSAFQHPEKRLFGALHLSHIVDHWEEVYERVKAQEDAQKPPAYNDITAQLAVLPEDEKPDTIKQNVSADAIK